MSLLLRIAVYVPVLLLIAFVVVGQHEHDAQATVSAAVKRTVRWLVWSAVLVGAMELLALVFVGW